MFARLQEEGRQAQSLVGSEEGGGEAAKARAGAGRALLGAESGRAWGRLLSLVGGCSGPRTGVVLFADVLRGKEPLPGWAKGMGLAGGRVGRTRPWGAAP